MTRDLIVGFLAGVVTGAAGYYYYRKNQSAINAFLAGKGINISGGPDAAGQASVEELVAEKERLEDLIAEREAAANA